MATDSLGRCTTCGARVESTSGVHDCDSTPLPWPINHGGVPDRGDVVDFGWAKMKIDPMRHHCYGSTPDDTHCNVCGKPVEPARRPQPTISPELLNAIKLAGALQIIQEMGDRPDRGAPLLADLRDRAIERFTDAPPIPDTPRQIQCDKCGVVAEPHKCFT